MAEIAQENNTAAEQLLEDKPKEKKRVWEIDFIRGVAILGMVVDHFIWDLSSLKSFFFNFYEVNNPGVNEMCRILSDWYGGGRQYFHNLAVLFFIISGISSTFSRNNWKHTRKIFLAAFLLFAATYGLYHISFAMGDPFDFRIIFGVLYALAMGTLFISLLPLIYNHIYIWIVRLIEHIKSKCASKRGETYEKRKIDKAPDISKWIYLGVGLSLIVFWIIYTFTYNYPVLQKKEIDASNFWHWWIRKYDSAKYIESQPPTTTDWFTNVFGMNFHNFILCALGLRSFGSDFFSMIPWVGWTLIGAFIGKTVYAKKQSILPKLDGKWNKPFAYAGNKCLWIYVFHQVVLVIIIAIVFCPMGYRFF